MGVAGTTSAQSQQQLEAISRLLDNLPESTTTVSASFVRLPDGTNFCEHNAELPLIPASNQKVITGAAALEILGVDYIFETTLSSDDRNLIIRGSGDPGFGDPRLADDDSTDPINVFRKWLAVLRSNGITHISGDILIDDRVFDNQWVHPSWEPQDLAKWYAAPVGGLNFNDNCIEVTLWPTTSGELVGFEVFPPTPWINLQNNCRSGNRKPWIHRKDLSPTFELRGQTSKRVTLQPVAISDPGIFTGQVFKQVLAEGGVVVQGDVKRAAVPLATGSSQRVLDTHQTHISKVLRRSLSQSQNLFAECLLKSAGRHSTPGKPGSWDSGTRAVLHRLQQWNIDTQGMVIADGSGLSRDNRISARHIVDVLRHVYMDKAAGGVFINSLALNGSRGTLRKRMADMPGQIWGKSGYMKGIRSLSGYVASQSGKWYAFSVMFNDIRASTGPYNQIHEQICEILAKD